MAKAIGTFEERFVKWLGEYQSRYTLEWVRCDEFAEYVNWSETRFADTMDRLIDSGQVRYRGHGGGRIQLSTKAIAAAPAGVRVFISYSHDDDDFRKDLHKHLSPLEKQKKISVWSDREIPAGDDWEKHIQDKLDCDIFIVLVSASFISSTYCYDTELREAIARHKAGELKIIPVVVRNCIWSLTPLGEIQHATVDGVAIASAANRDDALTAAAASIAKVVDNLIAKGKG